LIDADLSFDNLDISQKNTEDFNENWTQGADTITIEDASIVTDYLFQEFVSLEGAKISTAIIDGPEKTDDGNSSLRREWLGTTKKQKQLNARKSRMKKDNASIIK